MTTIEYRSRIPAPAQDLFVWHTRPGAFERLIPPWESVRLIEQTGSMENRRVVLKTRVGPLWLTWVAQHVECIPGRMFRDVQMSGPFARWDHTHRIEPVDGLTSELIDHIEYDLPGGALGRWLAGRAIARTLNRQFAYRHLVTAADLAAHSAWKEAGPMKIAITGSSGLIGGALAAFLTTGGHQVVRLVRGRAAKSTNEATWDPATGKIDPAALENLDALVHLAGESLAQGRWTKAEKARIYDSRIKSTAMLARMLAGLEHKPKVMITASAIGFYGDRGDELLTESSSQGGGFVAEVCRDWEAASQPAEDAGIRVARLRLGIVLTPAAGALAKILPPFKFGLGGIVGNGRQYWSWITLDDAVSAFHHVIMNDALSGVVNVVAPQAPTNYQFTKTLGKVLGRPTIFPLPTFVAKVILGQMAQELLLASARVAPTRLQATGFAFRHPDLEPALRYLLGKQ